MKNHLFGLVFLSSFLFASQEYVTYEVDGKKYEGYYTSPSKNAPLVYLVHDWDGLTDYEVKRAKMLSDLGYATFAVDLYGKDIRPTELEDKKRLTSELYKDREKMKKLLYAAFEKAKAIGANVNNSIGIGYCFGGSAILEFARAGVDMKKFISFHGGLSTPKGEDYKNTKGEVVVFHGTADKVVSIQEFASLAEELETTGIKHEMITYSGAPHAFTIFSSQKYNERADKASWKRFTEILEDTF